MSQDQLGPSSPAMLVGIQELRHNWGWFLGLGVLLIIAGMAAIGSSVWMTGLTVMFLGWMLLFSGVIQAANFFWRKQWKGFFIDAVSAALYILMGIVLIKNPLEGAVAFTMLIAILLIAGGIFRIAVCLMSKMEHKMWLLLHGVVSIALGGMILQEWPESGLWVIGLFVGIDMLIGGWSMVMLAFAAKNMPSGMDDTGAAPV